MRAEVRLRVPGDKSISQRALLFAALAEGESRVRGLLPGEDPQSMASVLRSLGAAIPPLPTDGGELRIVGGGPASLRASAGPLDCGNSGTAARLLLGVLAGLPGRSVVDGDPSLRSRPMRRVTEPLADMGASFRELGAPDRLPVEVAGGALRSLEFASPRASAQVKSAVLLAGLVGGVEVVVSEPALSRDHTERMLAAMGAPISTSVADGRPGVRLRPGGALRALDLDVPGDFSSAAFLLALSLLAPRGRMRIEGVGVNPTRTGLLPILTRMGASVELQARVEEGGEPRATLVAEPSRLEGTTVATEEIPAMLDEVPVLAILAARARGETRITGAGELRVKETDRLRALAENLRSVGADAEELPDGLLVRGGTHPLTGRVRALGDHRIAMAFGVLGALPGNHIVVDEPEVAAVSYPGFWGVLADAAEKVASP